MFDKIKLFGKQKINKGKIANQILIVLRHRYWYWMKNKSY